MMLQYAAFLVGAVTAGGHGAGTGVVGGVGIATGGYYNGYNSYNLGAPAVGAAVVGAAVIEAPVLTAPVLPVLPSLGHGHGHKKHGHFHHQAVVQPVVVAEPKIVDVEVEHFVSFDGPLIEQEHAAGGNVVRRELVTHHPVYHKNILNSFTEHDVVNKDVFHHLTEDEARHYDVEGKQIYVGEQHIDHGRVGHAAYGEIVGGYGYASPIIEPVVINESPVVISESPVVTDIDSFEYVRPGAYAGLGYQASVGQGSIEPVFTGAESYNYAQAPVGAYTGSGYQASVGTATIAPRVTGATSYNYAQTTVPVAGSVTQAARVQAPRLGFPSRQF